MNLPKHMKSLTICGSRRYKKEIREFAAVLKKAGIIVYEPILNDDPKINELQSHFKKFAFLGLTHHQFSFIRKADVIFFYNKEGYLGNSSTLELGFAEALGKPIYALEEDKNEPCRNVLFDEIVKTPEELIKKLR
jgi:nucleoside 2-deoxyribosyltransferase